MTGCAVDQQKEVAMYRKVLDGQTHRQGVVYQTGQPLSLHQALQLASANSEQLAIDGEDYLQALIDKDRAAANFLPTVSFAPTFTRQDATHIGGPAGVAANFVPKQSLDLPLHAGMDVSPVADAANIARAKSNAKAQHAILLDLKAQVLMDVAATYYQILRTTSQVRVLENSVIVQQKRLVDMQAKKQAGTALPLDVAQIRAQLARTRSKLIRASNDLHNGRSTLAYLIGVPVVDGTLTDELSPPATTPQIPMLVRVARLNRQDVMVAAASGKTSLGDAQAPGTKRSAHRFKQSGKQSRSTPAVARTSGCSAGSAGSIRAKLRGWPGHESGSTGRTGQSALSAVGLGQRATRPQTRLSETASRCGQARRRHRHDVVAFENTTAADLAEAQSHIELAKAGVATAQANVASAASDAQSQQADLARYQKLLESESVTAQQFEHTRLSQRWWHMAHSFIAQRWCNMSAI